MMASKGTRSGRRIYRSYCKKCASVDPVKKKRYDDRIGRNRAWFVNYKRSLSCIDCGRSFSEKYWLCDFHHLDPTQKDFSIAYYSNVVGREKLMTEINKCIPLCACCHRDRHHKEDPLVS